jgi:DNA-binding XRE family transcriptional regulator
MTKLKDLKARHMRDPEFRKEYEKADLEYAAAEELIKARTRAGMTQQQVAEALGTTQSSVARMESGSVVPSLKTIRRFAEVTGSRVSLHLDPAE